MIESVIASAIGAGMAGGGVAMMLGQLSGHRHAGRYEARLHAEGDVYDFRLWDSLENRWVAGDHGVIAFVHQDDAENHAWLLNERGRDV